MSNADLLFRLAPGGADLLFGEVESFPDIDARVEGALPGLTGAVFAGRLFPALVSGALPGVTGTIEARYVSGTDRPLVSETAVDYERAEPLRTGASSGYVRAVGAHAGSLSPWGAADSLQRAVPASHQDGDRSARSALHGAYAEAETIPPVQVRADHQNMLRDRRLPRLGRYQTAAKLVVDRRTDWQDRHRDRRPHRQGDWGRAKPLRLSHRSNYGEALARRRVWQARYQEAMRPPPGVSDFSVVLPPFNPCYLPDPDLLFQTLVDGTTDLLFRCDFQDGVEPPAASVLVPIRKVYIVNNTVAITRVVGSVPLSTLGFSLDIDADSWTWSWSATLPLSEASLLQPTDGAPVEVEAAINGVAYRLLVERVSTDRTFAQRSVRVSGRGLAAVLADPYADRRSFAAANARTAQQLMEDALTDNGVPLGWTLDFGVTDWLVPGDTWTHQGTWLTAVRTLAEAAGGYVQPHRTAKTLRVLPRYPAAPWEWAGLAPDYELPSAAVTQEAIEWVDKPVYNRVFVMGERNGVLARVTRAGTAGDATAPSIVDPLITSVVAARQRGLAALADVGRQASLQISLPVLSETGVIAPGVFVRYVDGATTRFGLVRTTSVSGGLQLRQTLGIETHVAP